MNGFNTFAAAEPAIHVSLPAEQIFTFLGLPITNSMILGAFGYVVLVVGFLLVVMAARRGSRAFPVQLITWGYEGLLKTSEDVLGSKSLARKISPLAITLFFFIIANYWLGILPIVGPITYNGAPLFRGLAADLNVTFALAIITLVVAQLYAIKTHGFVGNIGRYLQNPIKNPIGAFEGFLEIFADFSRYTALSLRLFGNVFAGEVLLVVVAFLSSFLSPVVLPFFLAFELFIGFIQAYVFFMLTIVFISLGTMKHGHGSEAEPRDTRQELRV